MKPTTYGYIENATTGMALVSITRDNLTTVTVVESDGTVRMAATLDANGRQNWQQLVYFNGAPFRDEILVGYNSLFRRTDFTLDGAFVPYTDGGYPLLFHTDSGSTLCADCATFNDKHHGDDLLLGIDIFHEGPPETCDNCDVSIFSAYGDPNAEPGTCGYCGGADDHHPKCPDDDRCLSCGLIDVSNGQPAHAPNCPKGN